MVKLILKKWERKAKCFFKRKREKKEEEYPLVSEGEKNNIKLRFKTKTMTDQNLKYTDWMNK